MDQEKNDYDFYRCYGCRRLITKLDEQAAQRGELGLRGEMLAIICPCGSTKYSPANMLWYHWLLPRVWKFAFLRARGLA